MLLRVNATIPVFPATPRVAIVGAGAVGGYYGAQLARAGLEVNFLLRRDLAHVRAHGLRIKQPPAGDFTLQPARAFATPAEVGPVDLVVIGLKATANEQLRPLLPPLLGAPTAILLLQNGLGGDEFLARHFGAERVLGGLCFVCLNRTGPGEITCTLPGYLALGEFAGPATARLRELAARFTAAGVRTVVTDNLAEARWQKLVWNVPFNGLAIAAGGVTTDVIMADATLRAEARALMDEIVAAAACFGYTVPPGFIQMQLDHTAGMGPYRPSSLIDWQEGRAVEVEAIWGEPLRRAQGAGAALPHLEHLYTRLKAATAAPPDQSTNS
jgi:2-dehydropantoate 2-reductase